MKTSSPKLLIPKIQKEAIFFISHFAFLKNYYKMTWTMLQKKNLKLNERQTNKKWINCSTVLFTPVSPHLSSVTLLLLFYTHTEWQFTHLVRVFLFNLFLFCYLQSNNIKKHVDLGIIAEFCLSTDKQNVIFINLATLKN